MAHHGLGREEFIQKLLSTLVFGHTDHRWNVPGSPSQRGRQYLQGLVGERFSGLSLGDDAQFVDEFELARRHGDERAGWPDQAVITSDRLLLVELKTEKASHRPGQLVHYLALAAHHYPRQQVNLLYLTPTMTIPTPRPMPPATRYAHVAWQQITPLIIDVWGNSSVEWERTVAARLVWWLDEVETQRHPRRASATPSHHSRRSRCSPPPTPCWPTPRVCSEQANRPR